MVLPQVCPLILPGEPVPNGFSTQINRVYFPPVSQKGPQEHTGCLHFVALIH